MKYFTFTICFLIAIIIISAPLGADTVILKSGSSLTGEILADRQSQIVIDIGAAVIVLEKDQIYPLISNANSCGYMNIFSASKLFKPKYWTFASYR